VSVSVTPGYESMTLTGLDDVDGQVFAAFSSTYIGE
jgi:hypothetical protein